MNRLAAEFIKEVKSKRHVARLLKNASFSLCIKAGNEMIPLRFINGKIEFITSRNDESFDVFISGSEESIHSILTGRKKLRESAEDREIELNSTFRKALFLESLFYLATPRSTLKSF